MCLSTIQGVEAQIAKATTALQEAGEPIPAPIPIPEDATKAERLCALAAYLLYLLDLIDCLNETDPTQCVADAAAAYSARRANCFPEGV